MPESLRPDKAAAATIPCRIALTGASSGLGAALAQAYARPGVSLWLSGRDAARLNQVADAVRAHGAKVVTHIGDVADAAALEAALLAFDGEQPIDLVIANAGVSGLSAGVGAGEIARTILATNVRGVLNTVEPLLPRLLARRRGQIALIASLAGYHGYPSARHYAASKAWVRAYGEGLRGAVRRHGIAVSIVNPGFIKTPLTDKNPFPMPLILDADRAARLIQRKLAKRQAVIAFPTVSYLGSKALGLLPPRLFDALTGRVAAKEPLT